MFLIIFIPARIVPGNDLAFQLSLIKPLDWTFLLIISSLTALLLTFNIYLYKNSAKKSLTVKRGGFGLIAGTIAGLFGSLTCAACALSFLGFLSFGTVVFLAEYRFEILLLAMLVVILSLYYSVKRILGLCQSCKW